MFEGISDRGGRTPRWRGLAALAVVCVLTTPAIAQQAFDPNDPRQQLLDQIYEQLLDDPTDAELNRRLAQLALELGDLDAAIGATERLVFLYPDNVALQIEVAQLYFELESYAAARGYLDDALALPGITPAEQAQVTALLEDIEEATRPPVVSGIAQVGLRYQTNANIGPSDPGEGQQVAIEEPAPDFNAFALGTVAYNKPINDHLSLEATVSALYAEQFEIDRLDIGFAEFQAGPRFFMHDSRFSVKPYALGHGILLADALYQLAYGGGVTSRVELTDDWRVETEFEYKNRTFYNSEDYGTATDQSGDLYSLTLRNQGSLTDRTTWSTRASFNLNEAAEDHQSYEQFIGQLGLTFEFDVDEWLDWKLSPYVRFMLTDYNGVAPQEETLEFDTVRGDVQLTLGASLEVPVKEFTSFGAQVQYTVNESTLDRYTYDNLQVLLGPIGRF